MDDFFTQTCSEDEFFEVSPYVDFEAEEDELGQDDDYAYTLGNDNPPSRVSNRWPAHQIYVLPASCEQRCCGRRSRHLHRSHTRVSDDWRTQPNGFRRGPERRNGWREEHGGFREWPNEPHTRPFGPNEPPWRPPRPEHPMAGSCTYCGCEPPGFSFGHSTRDQLRRCFAGKGGLTHHATGPYDSPGPAYYSVPRTFGNTCEHCVLHGRGGRSQKGSTAVPQHGRARAVTAPTAAPTIEVGQTRAATLRAEHSRSRNYDGDASAHGHSRPSSSARRAWGAHESRGSARLDGGRVREASPAYARLHEAAREA
jgi:hypothetical protein